LSTTKNWIIELKVEEVCRKHAIAPATYYKWKVKFGGMSISEAKRLKALELENSKLKRLVADQALDIVVLKDALNQK
jgi:putative transposase